MIALPIWLVKNWKLIVGGVAIVAVVGTVGYLKWQLDGTRDKLDNAHIIIGQKDASIATLEQANVANAAFAAEVQEDAKKAISAMDRTIKAQAKAIDASNKIIWSLKNVPPQPLSPVLRCYLERLWALEHSAEDSRAGEGVREAGNSADLNGLQDACAPVAGGS